MAKANVLTLRIPFDLKHRLASAAEKQGVSITQLAMYIFAKEIGNLESGQTIKEYWQGYSKKELTNGFDDVMSKVRSKRVPAWDKMDA